MPPGYSLQQGLLTHESQLYILPRDPAEGGVESGPWYSCLENCCVHVPFISGSSWPQSETMPFGSGNCWQPRWCLRPGGTTCKGPSQQAILGCYKTLHLLSREFWWPQMQGHFTWWVQSYNFCRWAKDLPEKLAGLLQPLPIPTGSWEMASLDFIMDLSQSQGHTCILVIVDWFTKLTYFIPYTNKGDTICKTAEKLGKNLWVLLLIIYIFHCILIVQYCKSISYICT